MTDFAVIIGVARYPELSAEGVAADLDGPNNDALAVHDWLVDPDGGGLAPDNVKLIRSADWDPLDPDDPQPARARIERALKWLEEQTREDPGGRLYLYFSGHGFSPVMEEGALFTADATQASPEYVYAHAWMRWFRMARRFRQTVLWMDSCMNYQQSVPVTEVMMRPKIGTGVPGPAFVALAAQTKSALEHTMSDGQVHGVFTWTLLQGLRGGAADEYGQVTGKSLRTFLYTAMPEFLPDTARNSTAVDLYPFVQGEAETVFRRLPAQPTHPVRLVFPAAAVGAELRIWTGQPLAQVVSEVLATPEWSGELPRGLYVAELPFTGLRHGFQVSGAGAVVVVVDRTGPPVMRPAGFGFFQLDVVAGNPAAVIRVMDDQFDCVFAETGELHVRAKPGVYKVRVEFGRDITMIAEEVLLLDRDGMPGEVAAPQLASPAPIPGTASTHEFHVEPFEEAAGRRGRSIGPAAGQSAISVLSRYWTEPGAASPSTVGRHPMQGLQLVDAAGQVVADLAADSAPENQTEVDAVAVWERDVPPGSYYLRQVLSDGRQYEGCVIASLGWVTQLAIQRPAQDDGAAVGDLAIFMRRAGERRAPDQDAVTEAARVALTQGRNLFADGRGAQLAEQLVTTITDPVGGIIGGHLLLRAMDGAAPDPVRVQQFDALVTNLRALVGPGHPDVEALSLRCTNVALATALPFTAPPMFRHGWQLVTEATYQRAELVPMELWQRVHASVALGAFFVWAADEQTRTTHAQQLSRWIADCAHADETAAVPEGPNGDSFEWITPADDGAGPMMAAATDLVWAEAPLSETARDAAYRQQVPAAAVAQLWSGRGGPDASGAAAP